MHTETRRDAFERLCLNVVAALLLATVFFFALAAFAQTTDVLTPPPVDIDPANKALIILDGIKNGQWWLVAAGVVSLMTWGVRSGILKRIPGAAGVWFSTHPAVGYAIPFVLSAIGGITTTFASGVPFTWGGLVGEILKVSLAAVGLFIGKRTIDESRDAGKAAAAAVETREQANAVILKP